MSSYIKVEQFMYCWCTNKSILASLFFCCSASKYFYTTSIWKRNRKWDVPVARALELHAVESGNSYTTTLKRNAALVANHTVSIL